ncbi:MAG: nucleotide-binding protein [Bacteroidales bacterium]|nr:nucleotide-binding protein [Bacteroidales bacterium]
MTERERIENLHQKYFSLRENTPPMNRDGEECKAYHEWYESAYVYFKSFDYLQNDSDFQIFVNAKKNGNCFVLEQIYDSISPSYKVLMELTGKISKDDKTSTPRSYNSKKVFVVHGHNNAVKQTVARTIENLGLTPVILAEQPDKGRTVIEKFEREGNDVGFAVVLLTADDKGRKNYARKMQDRARQNVVFEMGYFMALLGRERVFLLLQKGVEEPSDLKGVVYTPLDKDGAWQYRLVKELREQGYDVTSDNL